MKIDEIKENIEEKEKILELLNNPEVFEKINKEFDKKIVREINTRKTIFLCMCGIWVENHNLSSYNLMVNSDSGAGKDYIVKAISGVIPDCRYVYKTRISPTVFTYWHNARFEPDWTWNGKIFYNEDIQPSVMNSDVFKVFLSSGSTAVITIKQIAVEIEIRGKPVMIVTTARPIMNPEIVRRFNIVNLDESVNQTNEIMKRHAEYAKKGLSTEYDPIIKKALSYLKRVKVKVPYADKLVAIFPKEHIIMRTHFVRFLDYIKASCALHQFQRKQDEEGYYLANEKDYEIAKIAFEKTMSNPYMIPLSKDQQKLLKILEKLGLDSYHSVKEISVKVNFLEERQLRRQLDKLAHLGFIDKSLEERQEGRKKVICYKLVLSGELKLPNFQDVVTQKKIKDNTTQPVAGLLDKKMCKYGQMSSKTSKTIVSSMSSKTSTIEGLQTSKTNDRSKIHTNAISQHASLQLDTNCINGQVSSKTSKTSMTSKTNMSSKTSTVENSTKADEDFSPFISSPCDSKPITFSPLKNPYSGRCAYCGEDALLKYQDSNGHHLCKECLEQEVNAGG